MALSEKEKAIANVLLKHEPHLSDGYEYYCGRFSRNECDVQLESEKITALRQIAREILGAIDKLK